MNRQLSSSHSNCHNPNVNPTGYPDADEALDYFLRNIQSSLAGNLVGLYAIGSLALGDFDPSGSDVDIVAVTHQEINDADFASLSAMHAEFSRGPSPLANRIDAVYVTKAAFSPDHPQTSLYPTLEHGTELFRHALEDGWVFQTYTLREKGLVVWGADPRSFISQVDPGEMIPAVKAIAGMWLEDARLDPTWLEWVSVRKWQVFVIQTLCRMLYSLLTGDVTSKPAAVEWARRELGQPWAHLIAHSLSAQDETITERELEETLLFIRYTFDKVNPNP
ncbi:aminoglycoside adenylyltransferase domain-containing protein [Paenibacillus koleovorans]|uniref:aminoglycoside adenylyltransferase domain-containing protein n=1 Tax=Paenibacillus koleovorans TaxID=121608 RepID=UPI000FDBDB1C|nr:aminoglycoside adenylyltransferase domain-containing protein [Paenibacillus koleovorans]